MSAPHADDRHPRRPGEADTARSGAPRNGHRPAAVLDALTVPEPRGPGIGPGPTADPGPPDDGPARPVPTPRTPAPQALAPQGPTARTPLPGAFAPPDPFTATGPVQGLRTGPHTPPLPWPAVSPAPVPVVFPPGPAAPDRRSTVAGRAGAAATLLRDGVGRAVDAAVAHRTAALGVGVTLLLAAGVVSAAYSSTAGTDGGAGAAGTAQAAPAVPVPGDLVDGTTAADPAAFASGGFRSPTGNINCRMGEGETRCDTRTRSWSPPADPACPGDAGAGLVLGGPDAARPSCGGDPVGGDDRSDGGVSELDYGTHLTRGDVTCVSRRSGVECRDARTGHGFETARASYRLY